MDRQFRVAGLEAQSANNPVQGLVIGRVTPAALLGYSLEHLGSGPPTLFGSLWQVTLGKFLVGLGQEYPALFSVGGDSLHFCVLVR